MAPTVGGGPAVVPTAKSMVEHGVAVMDTKGPGVVAATTATASSSTTAPPHPVVKSDPASAAQASADIHPDSKVRHLAF